MGRKWKYALIGSLVTAGLLGGLAAGTHRFGPRLAFAEMPTGHGFGHWRDHAGGGHGHVCGPHGDAALDAAIVYLERRIDPSEAQAEPFARLSQSLRAGAAIMAQACGAGTPAPDAKTAAASLGRMEALMTAGLDALREIRPAFDALYAVLDASQRKALDELFEHRHLS